MSDTKETIKQLHATMTFHVEKSKVNMEHWNGIVQKLDEYSEDQLEKIVNFLSKLKVNEWSQVHKTWTLPNATPEMWENMEVMFSPATFPEYVILDRHRKNLLAACRRFLSLFNGKVRK